MTDRGDQLCSLDSLREKSVCVFHCVLVIAPGPKDLQHPRL